MTVAQISRAPLVRNLAGQATRRQTPARIVPFAPQLFKASAAPIPAKILDRALQQASASIPSPSDAIDPRSLLDHYTRIARAESAATAVLLESEGKLQQRALEVLAQIGRAYADHMPIFGATVHAGKAWPTISEDVPGVGRRYVNSFKKSEPLSFEKKAEIYRQKVEKFLAEGGDFERDLITLRSIPQLEPGVRYDYVLLEDGTIRCAPRGENLPDPGHAILAEGGPQFRDTRVLMAGELRTIAGDRGVLAVVAACSSGHFKPLFEDVPRMKTALAKLGISRERVILNGGPDNPSAILPEIAEKFGLQATLPDPVEQARAALRRESAAAALKVWQRG